MGPRIAQVVLLYESVPRECYSRTERVMSHLTEERLQKGHVAMFLASGDSETNARLVTACARSLRLDKRSDAQIATNQSEAA